LRRGLLAISLVAAVAASVWWLRSLSAPLDSIVQGGDGPPTVVLLHGYGSRAEDWLQFNGHFAFPPNTRVILPQAPLRGPFTGQRGWWWLNLEGNVPEGQRFADYSNKSPGGIAVAAKLVRDRLALERGPIVLGGFSQGAMTSAEVAFNSDQELAGLILLGGTTVHEEKWAERFAARRSLPIFIAHGRYDGVLAFEQMERFQGRLKASGMDVTWLPFEGEHGIPEEVVQGMNRFVNRVVGLQSAPGRP
jgi:phospholipase/carboxylesterase